MRKRHDKFQKKRKYKYTFIFWLVGVGILLLILAVYTSSIKVVEVKPVQGSGGTTSERKSFQPSDPKENIPAKLLWGRDF